MANDGLVNNIRLGIVELVNSNGPLNDVSNISPEYYKYLRQYGLLGVDYELRRNDKLALTSRNLVEVYPLSNKSKIDFGLKPR